MSHLGIVSSIACASKGAEVTGETLHKVRLREYDAACAAGNVTEADKLARAALILEPTCFHRKR